MAAPTVQASPLSQHAEQSVLGFSGADAALVTLPDGVAVYDTATAQLVRRHPLGGAGRCSFAAPAVLDDGAGVIHAVLLEQQKPPVLVSHTAQASDQAGSVSSISDGGLGRWALPAGSVFSVHPLPGLSPAFAHAAVIMQDGRAVISKQDTAEPIVTALPQGLSSSSARVTASCSAGTTVVTALHTPTRGAQQDGPACQLLVYKASVGTTGPSLQILRSVPLQPPSAAATVSSVALAQGYAVAAWSTGAVTVIHGLANPTGQPEVQQLALPPQLAAAAAPEAPIPQDAPPASARKRKAPSETAGKPGPLVAAPVDDTQVLVGRVVPGPGETSDAAPATALQLVYALVDARFGCVMSSGTVGLEGIRRPSGGTLDPGHTQLLNLSLSTALAAGSKAAPHSRGDAELLCRVGGDVCVLRVHAPRATLLSMLGKMSLNNPNPAAKDERTVLHTIDFETLTSVPSTGEPLVLLPPPDNLIRPAAPANAAAAAKELKQLQAQLQQAAAEGRQLAPATVTRAASLIMAAFQQAAQQEQAHIQRQVQRRQEEAQQQQGGRHRRHYHPVTPVVLPPLGVLPPSVVPLTVSALAQACQWQQLQELLQVLPQQSLTGCPDLLVTLAQYQQYSLLSLACVKLDDVPAETLVDALKALLSAGTQAGEAVVEARRQYKRQLRAVAERVISDCESQLAGLIQAVPTTTQEADGLAASKQGTLALARCAAAAVDGWLLYELPLHALVSLHVDVPALQAAMTGLSWQQTERLLSYLAKWGDRYTRSLGDISTLSQVVLPQELLFPLLTQVLDWVKVAIDSNLPRLLMADRLSPNLAQLERLVSSQVKTCKSLLPLQGALDHILSGAPLPAAHAAAASLYVVEMVDMGISPQVPAPAAAAQAAAVH